jgi:DNA-binding response OmpR family regulator
MKIGLEEKNILYVEDDDNTREYMCEIFENYFRGIDSVCNAQEAIDRYKDYYAKNQNYYDIVISDIEMPFMNGIEFSKEILKINDKQIILVVSAFPTSNYLLDLINIGITGFLEKPINRIQMEEAFFKMSTKFKLASNISLIHDCTYDLTLKEFKSKGELIYLTKNEDKFIEFLINNKNRTNSFEDIYNYIYYDYPEKSFSKDAIISLVKRLRKKLPEGLIEYSSISGYKIKVV